LEQWPIHVAELCQRVVAQLAIYLEGREVRIDIPADLPQILGDGDLIALALRQLLDNARKYSPPSRPLDLVASVHAGRVLLVVRDYGPGIAKKDLDRVFEKFYRRDAVKKKVPGSGLGLHIAREIVRAHGGELYARAAEPNGTEFCLELPIYVWEGES
jgi:signal transduction histidine kinase